MKKKKRKLNLDDLEIESFATTVASEVTGAGPTTAVPTNICNTCYASCGGTCASCGSTCTCSLTGNPCLTC